MKSNLLKILLTAIIIAVSMPQEATAQRRGRRSIPKRVYIPSLTRGKATTMAVLNKESSSPWKDNHLETGDQPYKNDLSLEVSSDDAGAIIEVETSPKTTEDMVVVIKRGDFVVANAYVRGHDKHTFYLRSGLYQTFFYQGRGWNPHKKMPSGHVGGFDLREYVFKDEAKELEHIKSTYLLELTEEGNFRPEQSNKEELF